VPAVKFIQCRKIKTLVLSHSLAPTETGIGIETEIEIERGGLDVTTKLVVQLLARQIALAQSPVFLLSSSWLLFLVSYFLSLLVFPPPVFQYLFFFLIFFSSVLHFSQVELAVGPVVGWLGGSVVLHSAGVPSNNLQKQKTSRNQVESALQESNCNNMTSKTTLNPAPPQHKPGSPASPPWMRRPCGSSSPATKWVQKLQRC